jgi:hypothetical protein
MRDIAAPAMTLLRREPFAAVTGILFLGMTLPTLAGLILDGRIIAGTSVWLKPLKFQLSFAVHVLTVALALGVLDRSVREGWVVKATLLVFLTMSLFEVGWITVQGVRGVPSHFAADPFNRIMYVLMGIGATLVVLSTALLGALALRRPAPGLPRPVSRATGIGLLISGLAGLVTGWAISMNGGAVVGGTAIIGPTLPLFGWSGSAGDLRVAHFVGLHAAQFFPLLGLTLSAWTRRGTRRALLVASLLWPAVILSLLVQALAGRPFIPLV